MERNKDPQNLSREQRAILDAVLTESYLKEQFYFTGGTALSSFYLQHRYSEDIDLFSEKQFDHERIESIVRGWSEKLGFTFEIRDREVVQMYLMEFKNTTVKVDFAYYPYPCVEKGFSYHGLSVNSFRDIATNKLLCIQSRSDVKDFVDLYYLLKEWNIWTLSYGLEKKFRRRFDPMLYSIDFMKMQDFTDLPRMILPLTLEELQNFYLELAKELARTKLI